MRRTLTRLRTIALCLCLAILPVGAGTTYVALDPYEVLARADAVLTAQVTDVRAETRDEYVWTVVSLDVTEWLTEDPTQDDDEDEPAEPRETLELEFLGGESEGRRLLVAGAISWEPGAEVLIAIYEEDGAASPVVGFRQGLWRVSEEGLEDPDGRALALDAAGRLVRADRPAAAATVLDAVRQALAGDAPEPQDEAAEPEEAAETDPLREPADLAGEEQPDEELDEPPDGELAPADPSAPETPAAPTETIVVLRLNRSGEPELAPMRWWLRLVMGGSSAMGGNCRRGSGWSPASIQQEAGSGWARSVVTATPTCARC